MKRLITLTFFAVYAVTYSQQKITFTYDLAGNQTIRTLCLTGCSSKPAREIKEIEAVVDEDLQQFFPGDNISYYPNPVKEELYLKWESVDLNMLSSALIYSVSGQLLRSYNNLENLNTLNVSFAEYSQGVYLIALKYKNGDEKSIKIIKQ
ncbi:T9SS C-terminal target domain-containing protein [Flavobacterium crocinum]|uniref:T9SS C-terminal target domain-containing protein n=1 Tax=Flavobacterium crocinum TaxID=2183896 RepID=A0A2S1YQJ3_9FLAO|nr:T9SS type A sorting domain-containing protein [Flavobacterium crocinum]AWK06339.1 T9SS C-terminal target domain-containing protein [Flavobacterium crocinum]